MATGRQIQGDNRLVCCTSTLLEAYQLVVVTETNQYEMGNKSKIRLTGEEAILRLQPRGTIPTETVLMVNYPNPFNPETWIPFATESGFQCQPSHLRHGRTSSTASGSRVSGSRCLSTERPSHLLGWPDTIRRAGG